MRAITIVAIVAAAAAGIGSAYMLYAPSDTIAADKGGPQGDISADDDYKQVVVTVNGFDLVADIASTGVQKSRGLAVKDTLNETEGMLFVYTNPGEYAFWMKNMKFPIDIIWLDSERKVVHIEHSLEPCGESCPTYKPDDDALYVLETVAGFAEKHEVFEQTVIEFDPANL